MTLAPVTPALREGVLALAPLPEQQVFSGRARETLPAAEADPHRHPVAVLDESGCPVGFFVVDQSRHGLLLRAFFVDARFQRQGHAARALAALPAYVRARFPEQRSVLLTVNARNVTAYAAYLAGGFTDTGELYLEGPAGPQHVLRLEVGREEL